MIILLVTILLFGLLSTLSFFIAYYVTVMMNQSSSKSEPSINNIIMTQSTLLIQNIINATGDILSLVVGKTFEMIANIKDNIRMYVNFILLLSIVYSYMQEKESFLSNIDKFWRCGLHPFFHNILYF